MIAIWTLNHRRDIRHFRDLVVYRRAFNIESATFENLDGEYEEIIAMLNSMENKAEKFCF
jgi:hypothetical protein